MPIDFSQVTYVYSPKTPLQFEALKGIDLHIEDGSFVALVGRTGCGKSTLVQHINALLTPSTGEVRVDGFVSTSDKKKRTKKMSPLRKEVGLVFQFPEYQLFEDTVAKDIAFGPKNMKLSKEEIDRRVRNAMEVVGLPYEIFAERSPFELSGGEKRRAAIAGVIAMEPQILVLDEPVAGLDPAGRREILELIAKLKKEVSPTIIMVSHYMDDIAAMATRIVALKDGKIVADGAPERVFGDREKAREAGLDLPSAAKIADRLRARGIDVSTEIVTLGQLAEALGKIADERGLANAYDGNGKAPPTVAENATEEGSDV